MTYNVFGGILNLTQSINNAAHSFNGSQCCCCCWWWWWWHSASV